MLQSVAAHPAINFQGVFKIGDTANFIPYHHLNQIEIEWKTEKKKEKKRIKQQMQSMFSSMTDRIRYSHFIWCFFTSEYVQT